MKKGIKKCYVLSVLAIVFTAGCSGNSDTGLTAYYPFNGNADDESGNGNHGVEYNGVTYADGISGQAAKFDGENDFITIWNTEEINKNINTDEGTVSVWFNVTGMTSDKGSFIYQYYSDNNDRLYLNATYTTPDSADLRMGFGDKHKSSGKVTVNSWNHAVMLWTSAGVMKLYINSLFVNKDTFTNPGFQFKGNEKFYFGRGWDGNPVFFSGAVDELRIYSRVLSESEIQELYREGSEKK